VTWSRKNLEGVETIAPTASAYLTPERLEIQRTARRFAMEEVLPLADELDPQRGEIPDALLERLAELGYFGIMVDREHGGLGLGVFEYCLICEELARGWMSVASIIARGNGTGCASPDPDRRAELLRRSAAGRWIGGIAFSEPAAGSDLANVECSAERVGGASGATGGGSGDEWVITGTKRWVGHAERADFLHLLARTRAPREGEGRSDGLELFMIEKERGSFPDRVSGTPIDKIGYYGLTTWELRVDGLRVPADALQDTGQAEGQGFKTACGGSDRPGCRRRPARSGSRGARSRTRSRTAGSGCSSGTRSATSRSSGTPSPTCPPRWRRRGSCGCTRRGSWTAASPRTSRPRRPS
jgi:alkylation response protein AidB-like acyl-CoA dehydrogenase